MFTAIVKLETYLKKTMRNASAKRRTKSNPITYNPQGQTKDVNCNPRNPVNPDSN